MEQCPAVHPTGQQCPVHPTGQCPVHPLTGMFIRYIIYTVVYTNWYICPGDIYQPGFEPWEPVSRRFPLNGSWRSSRRLKSWYMVYINIPTLPGRIYQASIWIPLLFSCSPHGPIAGGYKVGILYILLWCYVWYIFWRVFPKLVYWYIL